MFECKNRILDTMGLEETRLDDMRLDKWSPDYLVVYVAH